MIRTPEAAVNATGVGEAFAPGPQPDSPELAGSLSKLISELVYEVVSNPLAGAVLVILSAILIGKLVDWILRATLRLWVKRSDTPLDDLALQHLYGSAI